jgi:transposase
MPKSPGQKIMELEAKVRFLEKQKALLEQQAHVSYSKAIIFDMMIDLAEKEYQIDIRKNSPPEQSNNLPENNTKQ